MSDNILRADSQRINCASIPRALRDPPQWILYRLVNVKGEDKPRKVPTRVPRKGRPWRGSADSTDPKTWTTFNDAMGALQRNPEHVEGLGFVFSKDDDFAGIDLDRCRDPETGDIEDWALEIIERFNSYTEISPSGTGVHMFIRGELIGDGNKKNRPDGSAIEVYDCERYFTVTGDKLGGCPRAVRDRGKALRKFHKELFPPEEARQSRAETSSNNLSDSEIIEKVRKNDKFDNLWNGDISQHGGDHSAADQALMNRLAFFCGGDREKMRRVFSQSGLADRKKWNRPDYQDRTINKAINGCKEFYGSNSYRKNNKPEKAKGLKDRTKASKRESLPDKLETTDAANAARFAEMFVDRLRYYEKWKKWLLWDGMRWVKEPGEGRIRHLAIGVSDALWAEGYTAWAAKSRSKDRIVAMVDLAKGIPELRIDVDQLNKHIHLLNVKNGTIDLRTGKLREHRQEDYLTQLCPWDYEPEAECPEWERFLSSTFNNDQKLIRFMQRFLVF